MPYPPGFERYLRPTYFLDSDNQEVAKYARDIAGKSRDPVEMAISMYTHVRDRFRYNPFLLDLRESANVASELLKRPDGHCVNKAVILAALARVVEIPSRLEFFIVENHLEIGDFISILGTNRMVFHGAAGLFLNNKWLTVTPAFNSELCHKLGVDVLEFNGREDAKLQEYDREQKLAVVYVHEYGSFHDLPLDMFIRELKANYPHLVDGSVRDSRIKIVLD